MRTSPEAPRKARLSLMSLVSIAEDLAVEKEQEQENTRRATRQGEENVKAAQQATGLRKFTLGTYLYNGQPIASMESDFLATFGTSIATAQQVMELLSESDEYKNVSRKGFKAAKRNAPPGAPQRRPRGCNHGSSKLTGDQALLWLCFACDKA